MATKYATSALKLSDTYVNTLPYNTCSTAAGTAAKAVSAGDFALETGAMVVVKFANTNTAANPTLNVSSTGAKAIYYKGAAITASYLKANYTYTFVYNGTQWELVGEIDTDTTYNTVSQSANGLMGAVDKKKLDGIAEGANANMQVASSSSEFNSLVSSANIGKVVSYNKDLYIIDVGAKEIEVGDNLTTIYFDTSVEPNLAALSYEDESGSPAIFGIDSSANREYPIIGAMR